MSEGGNECACDARRVSIEQTKEGADAEGKWMGR